MQKLQRQDVAETKSLLARPRSLEVPETDGEHRQQRELLFALQKVSEVLTLEVDIREILTGVATIIGKVLGAKWVNFWELTPGKDAVYIVAAYGMSPEYIKQSRQHPIRLGTAWVGRAVKTGKAWSTSDILSDPKLKELGLSWAEAIKKQDYRALLCIPLFSRKTTVGGMCLYYPEVHQFTDFEMRLVTIAGNQAATAISNAKILKDLIAEKSATLNILEDVEESRKSAEEERDKTQSIITNFADGLLLFNAEDKLSLVNPRAEKFFNIKKENIIGKSISDLNAIPVIKPVLDLIREEAKGVFRREAQINKDSVLEVSTVPIASEEETFGTLVILHDVTREKLIETMKTEFVSLAAHQLRTPLSAIKWTLRIILDGDLGKINQEQNDFLEKTYASNERMISLINDLLNVTRIEEGRYVYKPTLTDIETVAQFVVNSYKEEAERRQIKLSFKKSETVLPQVSVDVEKIRLSIQNFVDNAIRYTPAGGSVTISLGGGKKEVEILIKDTGLGIPKDQQKRVFAKFFRAANIMRTDTEGSGLGLFISKNIVEAHGGRVWFESEENKGSTFHLVLPVKE